MGIAFFFVDMLIRNWTTFAVLYLGIGAFLITFYATAEITAAIITLVKHDLRLSISNSRKTRRAFPTFNFHSNERNVGVVLFFPANFSIFDAYFDIVDDVIYQKCPRVSRGKITFGFYLFIFRLTESVATTKFPVERRT